MAREDGIKMIRLIHRVLVFCFLHIYSVGSNLPEITMSQIPKDVERACVVVLLQSEENTRLQACFAEIQQLFETFARELNNHGAGRRPGAVVKIGQVTEDFRWSPTESVKFDEYSRKNHESRDVLVAVFPQETKDRSCLLLPPKSYPKAEAYFGPHSTNALLELEFINVKCRTFVGERGTMSSEGLHRQTMLDNLFQVRSVSDVPMKSIVTLNKQYDSESDVHVKAQTCDHDGPKVEGEDDEICHLHQNILSRSKHEQVLESLPRCDRITMPTKEEFVRKYLEQSRPVIISNAAAHWPAMKKWTMDFLLESYGEKDIHLKLAPDGVFEGVEPAHLWEDFGDFEVPPEVEQKLRYPDLVVVRPATQNVKFSEFLAMIEKSHQECTQESHNRTNTTPTVSAYLEYSSIRNYFPELEDDVIKPEIVEGLLHLRHLNIWLSDGNTLGKLHFDPFDNFLCQLRGRKELILFEPHNNTQLYEAHIPEAILGFDPVSRTFRRKKLLDSTSMVMSPVDILNPDYQRFPAFADVYPLNCTIDEGDVLFMPAFWWHEVQSYPNREEGRNLAVNFWYEPFLTKEFPCAECRLDVNPFYRHLL